VSNIKTVKNNASWIITDDKDKRKVGSIVKTFGDSYDVHMRGKSSIWTADQLIKTFGDTLFKDTTIKKIETNVENTVYDYSTDSEPFNEVWHVQCKVPIYTKEAKSKSFYCAGHYVINTNKGWTTHFCPKLITLLKYKYHGPFKTKQKAVAFANKFVK
tara:strand:+ start:84 stop:557 length:474 start_codon:yes stop_codon:yes gene_type:complete